MLRSSCRLAGIKLKSPRISFYQTANVATQTQDSDKQLRNDIKRLGQKLGQAIKAENEEVYAAVEQLRRLGREVK